MSSNQRSTKVISISLPKPIAQKLEQTSRRAGKTRSAYISGLIERATEEARWQRIYQLGQATAKRYAITSEEDIDQLLHQ